MSRRSVRINSLEELGLLDCSSYASSIRSTTSRSGDTDITSISDHASSDASTASSEMTQNDEARPENELESKQHHYNLAYEALTGTANASATPWNIYGQPQPPSTIRSDSSPPAPMNRTSQQLGGEPQGAQPTSQRSSFQQPAHTDHSSVRSDPRPSVPPPTSQQDVDQPLAPQERMQQHQSRGRSREAQRTTSHHDGEQVSARSDAAHFPASHSANPVTQSSLQPLRAHQHPQGFQHPRAPERAERLRNLPRPSIRPVGVPDAAAGPTPSFPVSPSVAFHRSPSPGRGAWTSDSPRVPRPSFAERAREHMLNHRSLRLSLGRRTPSFTVHSVVRSPVVDVASGWSPEPLSGGGYAGVGVRGLEAGMQELGAWYEELQQQHQQRRESFPEVSTRQTVRVRGNDEREEGRQGREELFLHERHFDNPGQRTFFPSEWSQSERVRLEQDKTESHSARSTSATPARGRQSAGMGLKLELPGWQLDFQTQGYAGFLLDDDRQDLPSQRSSGRTASQTGPPSLPPSPPLCETPEQIPSTPQEQHETVSSRLVWSQEDRNWI
ncbi:hypothetical protein GGR52DRAFT_590510 [Hypoxylon sp. FL1284]|nr:hypothetical protein GGR52DRAFT_590510 [Hypoxylon sp. FL1284]